MGQIDAANGLKDIQVLVYAPKDLEPKHFGFSGGELVGDAARVAATSFGVQSNNPSFQNLATKVVLDRTKTLQDAGVDNGDKLELVDVGGGV
jgi:hypothetical protein